MRTRTLWTGALAGLLCASAPAAAQQLLEPAPGVHVLVGTSGNVAIAPMPDGVLIVDAERPGDYAEIVKAVAPLNHGPVRTVIDTHWHLDHSGANEGFRKAGATVIAHRSVCMRRATDQYMPAYGRTVPAGTAEALPNLLIDDGLAIFGEDEVVTLIHVPAAHTDGDLIVRFGRANLIHMGDVFFNGIWPFIDRASGGSVQGMIAGVDTALALSDAKTVIVPAHGSLTDRAGLTRYRAMLVDVMARVRRGIAAGLTRAQIVAGKPAARWRKGMEGNEDGFVGAVYDSLKGVGVAAPGAVAKGVCG